MFGQPDLPNNVSFLRIEAQQLQQTVGPWFGVLFLAVGAFALFGSAMGIIDYTSRLAADILKTTYVPGVSESRAYFWLVWGMVGLGCAILLAGMSQPITLLVISASTGGTMMFLYSFMLIALNRRMLPACDPDRPVQDRRPDLVHADVRIAGHPHHLYAGPDPASLTA